MLFAQSLWDGQEWETQLVPGYTPTDFSSRIAAFVMDKQQRRHGVGNLRLFYLP